ncbi:hypothetical protein GCM10027615_29110 [Plantactinospora veratri]
MNTPSSGSLARRTACSLAGLVAASALLLTAACASDQDPTASSAPSAPAAGSASPSVSPSVSVAVPRSGPAGTSRPPTGPSIPGLPGSLYYTDGDRLLRLTRTGLRTVLTTGAHNANVSPDGNHIAYIDDNDNVIVTDRNGNHRRTVMNNSIQHGYAPAWSPDSRKLLVASSTTPHQTTLGTLTIATTTFTP